jgi:hypothetical protein
VQLSTLVSEALSCIHGNVKAKVSVAKNTSQNNAKLRLIQLMSSIIKRSSIIDTARSLSHGCLEVDASHWNRYTFLVWCCSLLTACFNETLLIAVLPAHFSYRHQ